MVLVRKSCCCDLFRGMTVQSIGMKDTYKFTLEVNYGHWGCYMFHYDLDVIDVSEPHIHKGFTHFIYEMCTYSLWEIPKYRTIDGKRQIVGFEYPNGIINGAQKSIISSLVTVWSYRIDEIDVFDIAADLFIKLCQGHTLKNGNKRFAVIFTTIFLYYFGFILLSPDDDEEAKETYLEEWLMLSKTATTKINCYDSIVKERLKQVDYKDADEDEQLQMMKNEGFKELNPDELHELVKSRLEATSFFLPKHIIWSPINWPNIV